jgi:hypothetical protein
MRNSVAVATTLILASTLGSRTSARPQKQTQHQEQTRQAAEATASTKAWSPPKTADGQPDLQGVWVNLSATPFERPKALEGRALLTDDEVAELKRRADRIFKDGNADISLGDSYFLTALANPDRHRSTAGSQRSSVYQVEREFENRTSLIVDPPDGRLPPQTAEVRQKRADAAARDRGAASPEDLNNNVRCITPGLPRVGPGASGDPLYGYYQIFQSRGTIVLLMETFHDARIIPLDGRPHLSEGVRQLSGDARGRWEGNTLIVDTTNFSPQSEFMGASDRLHLVERLTRTGPSTIDYQVTVDDQSSWTRPWTALLHLTRVQWPIYEYACHEGNEVPMLGILGGARAAERARNK